MSTALITGASNGIGAEVAVQLAALGHRILVHYHHDAASAQAVLERLRAAGSDGDLLQADLSEMSGVRSLAAQARGVEILINNAGSLIRRTKVLDFDEELWNRVLTLNFSSAFFLSQSVLPGMVERGSGIIVNVSSVAARNGGGIGALAYSSAKAALSAMTKNMAKEFGPLGIRVNGISPGTIDTNYHRRFSTSQMLEAVRNATPLGRLGTSEEVAAAVVFLCSDGARFIQGQMIEVNGGFLMV